jgi:hypothetical protein
MDEAGRRFEPLGKRLHEAGGSHGTWSEDWTADFEGSLGSGIGSASENAAAVDVARGGVGGGGSLEGSDAQGEADASGPVESAATGGPQEMRGGRRGESGGAGGLVLVEGWHPQAGSSAEKAKAIATFWPHRPMPNAEDMARWSVDGRVPPFTIPSLSCF